MIIKTHIRKHKKWKQNPVEKDLVIFHSCGHANLSAGQHPGLQDFSDFLQQRFGISNLQPITRIICNSFFVANDRDGRRLFIKAGPHAGIYENEYTKGMMLYEIAPQHFLKPVYFNDYDKYKFFANEYVVGKTLKTAIMTHSLDKFQRTKLIGDIWRIFCALRASDVVHRDIRPDNFIITDGHLVLIDFQLAVSKSNYIELDYLARRPNRLRKLGNKKYRYRPFTWDDAYSLTRVLEFIGRDKFYGLRYDIIYKNIKAHIGKDKIKAAVREKASHRLVRHIKTMRI